MFHWYLHHFFGHAHVARGYNAIMLWPALYHSLDLAIMYLNFSLRDAHA